jgi:hypothetical protein
MATVDLTLVKSLNQIGNKFKHKDAIEAFNQKWATEIAEFENTLFVEDENENLWLLVKPWQELNISTSDYFGSDDKPNKSRAIFKLLSNIVETEGDCDFGFGELGFVDEFYQDLISLYKLENEYPDGYAFYATVTVMYGTGYYDGFYEFLASGGIKATFTYKEDEDEEYEEYDEDEFDEDEFDEEEFDEEE